MRNSEGPSKFKIIFIIGLVVVVIYVLIGCLMYILTAGGDKLVVKAYDTDTAVISELLGGEVANITESQVANIVASAKAYANIPATGEISDGHDEVKEVYLSQFMNRIVKFDDLAATVTNYETYLYGDGSASIEFTFLTCGENVKAYAIINSDGKVTFGGFENVYFEQYKMYEALVGDGAINPSADATVTEYYGNLSQEEINAVENGEYSSQKGDAE